MSNFFICRNRVVIEGEDIGEFEGFTLDADWRTFGVTATLVLPMYALGAGGTTEGKASNRIRSKAIRDLIKVCAEIDVYCWYEGLREVKVFHGYIERIEQGFPSKLYLRDGSFILRFGSMKQSWNGDVTLAEVIEKCIPVANEAFNAARRNAGLTRSITPLKYSLTGKNVQAITNSFPFDNFAEGRSPFEVIQYLMREIISIAGVSEDNEVWMGLGVQDSVRPVIGLSTRYNVIQRDIIRENGAFVDYDVQVTYADKDGQMYTVTATSDQKVVSEQSGKLQRGFGEQHRAFCLFQTQEKAQDYAKALLNSLKSERNKGSITTLLYPKMQLFDHVSYDDTVFDEYDAQYYVIGYKFTANIKGFYQKIDVTDRVFAI